MTVQQGVPDDAPGVILYAIGPLIGGKRKPPVFRVRTDGLKFYVENKRGTGSFGRWHALGESRAYMPALQSVNDLNSKELSKYGLSQW
jgi:hypothetical protein